MTQHHQHKRLGARQSRTGLVLVTLLVMGQLGLAQLPSPFHLPGMATGGSAASASSSAGGNGGLLNRALPLLGSFQQAPKWKGQRDSSPETLEILKARGYVAELYTIQSYDKTPLSVYRIINPKADPTKLNRYPALVLHGVAADSAQMIANSEQSEARQPIPGEVRLLPSDTSLALALANNNFDVFLADARGTNLNNRLVSQDIDPVESQKFWNFSLDEQVANDLPAIIDFVLAQSRAEKLHFIGHSEATFFMFALMARAPQYQQKLASFVALAPVAYVGHISGLALNLFRLAALVPDTINVNYMPQPLADTLGVGVRRVCSDPLLVNTVCRLMVQAIGGLGDEQQSTDFYGTIMKSTSIKAVKHFYQLYVQKRFGMYDYKPLWNLRKYGSARPPDYDLKRVTLPSIILFRGATDFLSNAADQQLLIANLGAKPYRDFNYPLFNHVDFLTGRHVVRDINLPAASLMLELLKKDTALAGRSMFVEPEWASLPRPFRPLVVVRPDGSRAVTYRSHLVGNLANGLIEAQNTNQLRLSMAHSPLATGVQSMARNQMNWWQNVGDKVHSLSGLGAASVRLPQLPGLG